MRGLSKKSYNFVPCYILDDKINKLNYKILIMNILRTDIDAVNAVLTFQISEADYAEKVEKTLKDFRKKANIPGFRVGMVPMGMIKKMYGRGVKADEINKLIQEEIYKYIADNKIEILGEPLPNQEDEQRAIDFDNNKEFEFKFDIAIAPEFEPTMNKKDSIKSYDIEVNDTMIDNQVKNYAARFGSYTEVEEAIDEKDMLKGDLYELTEEGKINENGIKVEKAVMAKAYMVDEEQKALFANAKKNSVIVFNPKKAYGNDTEVSSLLKISKEKAAELTSNFQFEITNITHFEESAIDKSLFDKVYPNANIETETDFRNKVAEGIKESYIEDSKYKFGEDARAAMVKKMDKLVYPEAFLKRWLKTTQENMSDERVEKEFPQMLDDLKWYLFKNRIIKDNELKVEKDEIENFARRMTKIQFAQYGMTDVPADILDNYSKNMLSKNETVRNIAEKVLEEKVFDIIRQNVKVVDTPISMEDFNKLFA